MNRVENLSAGCCLSDDKSAVIDKATDLGAFRFRADSSQTRRRQTPDGFCTQNRSRHVASIDGYVIVYETGEDLGRHSAAVY